MTLKEFKKTINNDKDYSGAEDCPVMIWIIDSGGKKIEMKMKGFGYLKCGKEKEFYIYCETKCLIIK